VPQAAVDSMVRLFGSRAEDLIAAIGPSVGACCYEVGPDVRQAFVSNGSTDAALAGWFTAQPAAVPGNPSMPGLPAEPQPGHSYFDGWACAREQLLESGLDHGRIHVTRLCTASHHDLLCSYRRDGAAAGRIAGAIRPLRRQTPEA